MIKIKYHKTWNGCQFVVYLATAAAAAEAKTMLLLEHMANPAFCGLTIACIYILTDGQIDRWTAKTVK